uniref:Uncharacterized protein n=1 Tax=Caenorhabditis japonica TaxID=281687 RepID=A0A8R1IDN7_CAEJA
SPLPHRPQTSVCNHLFSPGDGGPTFAPQQRESPRPSAKESVLVQGWNWSKRNIQPVMSRRSLLKSSNMSEATSSKSSNSLVSFTCNASTFTTKQSEKTTVSLDKNQNYKVNAVNDENKELDVLRFVNLDSSTSTSFYSTWYKREDFCRRMGQIEYLRATVESYPRRLRSVIAAKNGRIK